MTIMILVYAHHAPVWHAAYTPKAHKIEFAILTKLNVWHPKCLLPSLLLSPDSKEMKKRKERVRLHAHQVWYAVADIIWK